MTTVQKKSLYNFPVKTFGLRKGEISLWCPVKDGTDTNALIGKEKAVDIVEE